MNKIQSYPNEIETPDDSTVVILTESACKEFLADNPKIRSVTLKDDSSAIIWRDAVRSEILAGCGRFLMIGRGKPTALSEGYDGIVIGDHINVSGQNPLVGPNDERFGTRFPDISGLYDSQLGKKVMESGKGAGLKLQKGVILIPVELGGLTTLEQKLIVQNKIYALTKDVFAGAIAAKHAGFPCAGIILFSDVKREVIEKIAASLN